MDGISPTRGVIEGNNADITQSTGDSATIDNIHTKGIDPMDDLVASMKTARSVPTSRLISRRHGQQSRTCMQI